MKTAMKYYILKTGFYTEDEPKIHWTATNLYSFVHIISALKKEKINSTTHLYSWIRLYGCTEILHRPHLSQQNSIFTNNRAPPNNFISRHLCLGRAEWKPGTTIFGEVRKGRKFLEVVLDVYSEIAGITRK